MDSIIYVIMILTGLVTFLGAVLNWQGMYKSRRAKGIVSVFGLTGARIVYGIVGFLIMGAALLGFLGYYGG